MRTLDRYLLREFVGYLLLGLAGVVTIIVVVDVFEKIAVFLDHRAPAALIARFYLYRVPEILVRVLPFALLLASFLSLGQLNKFGELTAMRATGLSLMRILLPVFCTAAICGAVALALGEAVVPGANRERDRIYDQQIQRLRSHDETERADVTYLGSGGRIFYMRLYLVHERRMHEVSVQEFRAGQLARRLDAAEATWDGRQWAFRSGFLRTFEGSRELVEPFERMVLDGIAERPEDFAKESRRPGEMGYGELRQYVQKLRASGSRVSNYLVDLHLKLALPLVNIIVVMIGAPIASRLRMKSAALGFGLSIVIAFVYYVFIRTGQAGGYSGLLPPYLAAWLGDLVFGVVGLAMMVQAQRR